MSDPRVKLWRKTSYERRKVKGICTACINPAVSGKTMCEAHLEKARKNASKYQHRLKSSEITTHYSLTDQQRKVYEKLMRSGIERIEALKSVGVKNPV